MYKNKITLWGLDKKHKRSDVQLMLCEKRKRARDGRPPCLFVLRGWLVDEQDITRYCKRAKPDNKGEDFKPAAALASCLVCIEVNNQTYVSLRDPAPVPRGPNITAQHYSLGGMVF